MKSYRKIVSLHVRQRMAYVNITPKVEAALAESGIREGLCLVNSMHPLACRGPTSIPTNKMHRSRSKTAPQIALKPLHYKSFRAFRTETN